MKRILIIILPIVLFFSSCNTEKEEMPKMQSKEGFKAVGPYLTKDHRGNVVLCWTEQDTVDSLYWLKYAVYDSVKEKFKNEISIPTSAGAGNSAESMGKIAFKADGTVIAMFSKRFPNEKNPFAGAIFYSMSTDDGKNWSKAVFLHSDTSHAYGRSFFDLAVLKDGEIAAIWLDGRFGKSIKGSALFFAKTLKGKGFGEDVCLEKGTCECCRTDIFTDKQGNIHLAYRNIMYPSALSGKEVRDMVYKESVDNGITFTAPKTISKDNWEIAGCPHSGPSLAGTATGIHTLWYTAGGGPGLYYASSNDTGFDQRMLISNGGRHPQMTALKNNELAIVFEEGAVIQHKHNMNHGKAALAKLVMKIVSDGQVTKSADLTNGEFADHHAVLIELDGGMLVAWVRDIHTGSAIYYQFYKN